MAVSGTRVTPWVYLIHAGVKGPSVEWILVWGLVGINSRFCGPTAKRVLDLEMVEFHVMVSTEPQKPQPLTRPLQIGQFVAGDMIPPFSELFASPQHLCHSHSMFELLLRHAHRGQTYKWATCHLDLPPATNTQ